MVPWQANQLLRTSLEYLGRFAAGPINLQGENCYKLWLLWTFFWKYDEIM